MSEYEVRAKYDDEPIFRIVFSRPAWIHGAEIGAVLEYEEMRISMLRADTALQEVELWLGDHFLARSERRFVRLNPARLAMPDVT